MTMEYIIRKLGFDPFDEKQNPVEEPDGHIDDTGSPYDILSKEEMDFLAEEVIKRIEARKAGLKYA